MPPAQSAHRHPPARTPPRELELDALLALHRDHYRAYAELLLGPADTDLALRAASEHLAQTWPDIIGAENPTAHAWHAVRQRVHLLAGQAPLRPVAHLTDSQQDVLLLHLVLELTAAEIAELTGTDPAVVRVRIRSLAGTRRSGPAAGR